jgi:hypothetical protein
MTSNQEENKLPPIEHNQNPSRKDVKEEDDLKSVISHQSGTKGNIKSNSGLAVIRQAKLDLENEAKSLENRINMLRQEELKTVKKIHEIRKKAMEVYTIRQKNEEKHKEVKL